MITLDVYFLMRILISELSHENAQENIEICGKVVYIDVGNKNVTIKGIYQSKIYLIINFSR